MDLPMKTHLHLLCFLIIFFIVLPGAAKLKGQSPSKQFLDIFEKETNPGVKQENQYGNFKNAGDLSFFPDTLPVWFFQPPVARYDHVYAIGISDPDLSAEEAFQQAFYRAKVMAILLNSPQIEYFRDVYTSNREQRARDRHRQRFDTFFRLTASELADSSQFHIVDQHLTRYNEAVVLLGYMPGTNNNPGKEFPRISATASVLYIEAHIGEVYEPQASYDIISEIHNYGLTPMKAEFNCTRKNNRQVTYSQFLGRDISFPLFVYRYSNPSWKPYTKPLVSYHGLWGMYVQQMLEHITLSTEQSNIRLRSLGENSEPGASDMIREIASQKGRILINEVDFSAEEILFTVEIQLLD
jgi:hypothetical protein